MKSRLFAFLGIERWLDLVETGFYLVVMLASFAPVAWASLVHPRWVVPVALFCAIGTVLGLKTSERWFKWWRRA